MTHLTSLSIGSGRLHLITRNDIWCVNGIMLPLPKLETMTGQFSRFIVQPIYPWLQNVYQTTVAIFGLPGTLLLQLLKGMSNDSP